MTALVEHGLTLADIADMPNTTVGNGLRSITEGKMRAQFEPLVGSHIWRCPECHEGCFEPNVQQVVNTK